MNGVAKNIIVGAIITAGIAGMIAALSNKQTRDKIAKGIKSGISEIKRRSNSAEDELRELKERYERAKERFEEKPRYEDKAARAH